MQVLTGDASVELEGEGVLRRRAAGGDAHVAESGGRRQLVSGRGAGCGDWLQHTATIALHGYMARAYVTKCSPNNMSSETKSHDHYNYKRYNT